ncbi:MAG: hypothetical protein WA980_20440 [Shinella zoogloeoides]|uniref:hypothetical protein n=1 Tax=Shinella zoogloeoides TaxID=352475 RepID=UPI003C78F1D0
MRKSIGLDLKNIARGDRGYRPFRWKIAQMLSDTSAISNLNSFLRKKLLFLKPDEVFTALELSKKDFLLLCQFNKTDRSAVSYLSLLCDYVEYNIGMYRDIDEFDKLLSTAVLSGGLDTDIASEFTGESRGRAQCVFVMKAYCALFGSNNEDISQYFGAGMYADWLRQRLLYPLSYYFTAEPDSDHFDFFLKQLFADTDILNAEREVIQTLIDDNHVISASASHIFYLALLVHPYDAVILVARFYESVLARSDVPSPEEVRLLSKLAGTTRNSRLNAIVGHVSVAPIATETDGTSSVFSRLGLTSETEEFYRAVFSLEAASGPQISRPLLETLYRLRFEKYPDIADFHELSSWAARYSFSTAGRVLRVFMTSLYMWPRRNLVAEFFDLFTQIELFGALTSWAATSPRGYAFLRHAHACGRLANSVQEIDGLIEKQIAVIAATGRRWIKVFHWGQRRNEAEFRFNEWFEAIRVNIPLFGTQRYLSGIDWTTLDTIIDTYRIKPFLNNRDAIFVLMLRQSEERRHDSAILRFAMRPWAEQFPRVDVFADALAVEYGAASIVFLRRFLTADEILHLNLENNFTAAISERMNALEALVKKFKFSEDTITGHELEKEQKAVTSVLSLMSVNANQFEINWDTIKNEALSATADIYKAYIPLSKKYNSLDVVSQAQTKFSHYFSNKQSASYVAQNNETYIAQMAFQAIEVFFSNPAHGIESVLAIRIRHDNIRREFDRSLEAARLAFNLRVPVKNAMFAMYREVVSVTVREWVRKYMHTGRNSPETALFNFVPNQADLDAFIKGFAQTNSQEDLIDAVIEWIRSRLDVFLGKARELLSGELVHNLKSVIEAASADARATRLPSDVLAAERVALQAINKTAVELREWFKSPANARDKSISFAELLLAVEGRFEQEVQNDEIAFPRLSQQFQGVEVLPQNIRNLFVAMSELTLNAVKYGSGNKTRLRIKPFKCNGKMLVLFSSPRRGDDVAEWTIEGRPSGSYTEGIFNSGNTGLEKVAFLAASVVGEPSLIKIYKRREAFHILLPVGIYAP